MLARDYIRRIRENLQRLNQQRDQEALKIMLDATAVLKLRIQTTGIDAQGRAFAPYVPGYAKRRQRGGLQTGYVDFTVTGRLWANVQPRVEESGAGHTVVIIGARDEGNKDKLRGAVKKRGNILRLSQAEIALVSDANRERINKLFNV